MAIQSSVETSKISEKTIFYFPSSKNLSMNMISLKPLTLESQNFEKQRIQLWKVDKYGVIASVKSYNSNEDFIPIKDLRNPLCPNDTLMDCVNRLEQTGLRAWQIAINIDSLSAIVWPHLIAAGKGNRTRDIWTKASPCRYMTEADLINQLCKHGYRTGRGAGFGDDPNVWVSRDTRTTVHIDRRGEGNHPDEPDHIDIRRKPSPEEREKRWKAVGDLKKEKERIRASSLDEREKRKQLHEIDKQIVSQEQRLKKYEELRSKWRFAYNDKRPDGHQGPPSPAKNSFQQLLQQTGLVRSYNSTHSDSPMPEKGMTGGEIGGVACSTSYIEGLFDDPTGPFLDHHYFCMPVQAGGEVPFTEGELKQILRELAIGIYTHSTVPFFSLHFREQGTDLFPVIHPAYENTLVGRVIGMLDYIMKGYLNGGVYQDAFIDDWYKHPDWKTQTKSSLEQLIEFMDYCEKSMQGEDRTYLPLAALYGHLEDETEASDVLRSFTGFKNSFRIIAKQKSIPKEGPLLILDADFDVFYEINPSPEYKQALEEYSRKHGSLPPSYIAMEGFYRHTAKRIHDHMVKMPLCKKYFSMLSVISFFASYFSTLKQHRKVPCLPVASKVDMRGCPPLFPHLPVTQQKIITLTLNLSDVGKAFAHSKRSALVSYWGDVFDHVAAGHSRPHFPKSRAQMVEVFVNTAMTHVWEKAGSVGQRILGSYDRLNAEMSLLKTEMRSLIESILDSFDLSVRMAEQQLAARPKLTDGRSYTVQSIYDVKSELINAQIDRFASLPNIAQEVRSLKSLCTVVPSERDKKEMGKTSSVVGGCGLHMEVHKVQPSPMGKRVLQESFPQLLALEPEKWCLIDRDSPNPKAAFRLFLEDVPAAIEDDYEWMESLLTHEPERNLELEEKRSQLQMAMRKKDKQAFSSLLRDPSALRNMKDLRGRTLLHHAATIADSFYAQELKKADFSCSEKDSYGYLPMHYAAMQQGKDTLKVVFQKEHINAEAHNNSRPLSIAILYHNLPAVEFLLEQGALPALLVGGYTDLHSAIHEGYMPVIELLLTSSSVKKNLNVCSIEGGTPLMLACELDSLSLVQKLVRVGANPAIARRDGVTALEIAVRRGSISILSYLLEKTAPSLLALEVAAREGSVDIIKALKEHIYGFINASKDNAIHAAIRNGNLDVALLLVQEATNPALLAAINVDKDSPLGLAAGVGAWDIVETLIAKQVPIGPSEIHSLLRAPYNPALKGIFAALPRSSEQLQEYVLIGAQAGNHRALSEVLQPLGAKLEECKGPKGWRLPHYLAKSDGIYLFRMCMEHEEDLLQPLAEEGNLTVAAIAARYGSKRVFDYLLRRLHEKKVSLESAYQDQHLLYLAIEGGVADSLLASYAQTVLDSSGKTAAHVAASLGALSVLEKLALHGADLQRVDAHGMSPLDYAVRAQDLPSVLFLLSKGAPITPTALYLAASREPSIFAELQASRPPREVVEAALQKAREAHDKESESLLIGRSIEKGSPVTPLNADLQALPEAFKKGERELIQSILDKLSPNQIFSLEIQSQIIQGTPLQLLLLFGSMLKQESILRDAVKNFVRIRGADFHVLDKNGNTLAHLLVAAGLSPLLIPEIDLRQANYKGETPLHVAADKDNALILRELLDVLSPSRETLEIVDSFGRTPLMRAVMAQNEQNIELLILKGANLHHRDHCLYSSLALACAQGSLTTVKRLLQAGADPNQRVSVDSVTSLYVAAIAKHNLIMQHLLSHGANATILGKNGTHLIHALAAAGKDHLVRLLVAKGVSVTLKDKEGRDALYYAAQAGNTKTLKLLLSLLEAPLDQTEEAQLLATASRQGHAEAVQWLLGQGLDPGAEVEGEVTSFTLAAAGKSALSVLPLFAPYRVSEIPSHLRAAICYAISQDNIASVKTLFSKGIAIDTEIVEGYTGLQIASMKGALHCTQWLLSQGADPYLTCSSGETSLELAAANSSWKQFQTILDFVEPPVNKKYQRGETLLHVVSKAGCLQHLSLLISEGADLDERDDQGCTPLYRAVEAGHKDVARLLLVCGADLSITSTSGKTIPSVVPARNADIVQILQEFAQISQFSGETSLHRAVRTNSLFAVKFLASIVEPQVINQKGVSGKTALNLAIETTQKEMALTLLYSGAEMTDEEAEVLKTLN